MKTMNYLLAFALIFALGSCSKETALDFKGRWSKKQEKEEREMEKEENNQENITMDIKRFVYLELDLHQISLQYEYEDIQSEIVRIEEDIESSDGEDYEDLKSFLERLQDKLDDVQRRIDNGQIDYLRNEEIISEFRRGPGRVGNPCGMEERCNLHLENTEIYVIGREENDITTTRDDDSCGGLVDMAEVPGFDERIQEAIIESEEGCADKIIFSGVSSDGEEFTYSFPVAR